MVNPLKIFTLKFNCERKLQMGELRKSLSSQDPCLRKETNEIMLRYSFLFIEERQKSFVLHLYFT